MGRLLTMVAWTLIVASPLSTRVLSAQNAPGIRLGVGPAMSGYYKTGWGGSALAEFVQPFGSRIDMRVAGSVAAGNFEEARADSDLVAGLDVLGVVALGRVHLGGGLGYSFSSPPVDFPLAYDFGLTAVFGYTWGGPSGAWFVEGRVRQFGNVFYDMAATQGVLLITLGRAL